MPKRWSKCYSTELNTVTSAFNQYSNEVVVIPLLPVNKSVIVKVPFDVKLLHVIVLFDVKPLHVNGPV